MSTSKYTSGSDQNTIGDEVEGPRLLAAVVTYRRLGELKTTLDILANQTRVPDRLVVIDNGSEPRVRDVVQEAGAEYFDPGENSGPAGGIAAAMKLLLELAGDEDWIVLLDDDDPPQSDDALARIMEFVLKQFAWDARTGCVGVMGGRFEQASGRVHTVGDDDLMGPVPVDVIGGGHLPLIRVAAIRGVGPFDPRLFFGFEELEYGLRLRDAGYSIYADGDMWARLRASGLTPEQSGFRCSLVSSAAWRRYYAARNLTFIARRGRNRRAAIVVPVRAGLGGSVRLVQARRPAREVVLPLLGVWHALTGQLGRTVEPRASAKVAGRN